MVSGIYKITDLRNNLIKELATQGFTKKEIAEKANCSVRTIYRVLG